jgi:sortase A
MSIRLFERLLLAIGITLLAIWSAVWLDRTSVSGAAVKHFRTGEATKPNPETNSFSDPVSYSIVDFRLWSVKRIEAYGDSLSQHFYFPLAVLRIPRINLEVPVFNGTDDLTLDRGVGRILGTAKMGQAGNLGIAGHRDGFFRGLKDLSPGDLVELNLPEQSYSYTVSQIRIVEPDDVSVLVPTTERTLTLVTCFPFYYMGSAPKRYIVTASRQNSNLKK